MASRIPSPTATHGRRNTGTGMLVTAVAMASLVFLVVASPFAITAFGDVDRPPDVPSSMPREPLDQTGGSTTSETIGTGTRNTVLTDGDPLNMATGEHFFFNDLMGLGGPLPLSYRLYYGSQMDNKLQPDGLPDRFMGNHRIYLSRADDASPAEALVELGLGDEVPFLSLGGEWAASDHLRIRYQLRETADFYYLFDPVRELLWTLRKPETALAGGVVERTNVTPSGGESADKALYAAISASGRYVAFDSWAGDLADGDSGGFRDVFVRDRATGQTTRVSVSSTGEQGNAASLNSSLSSDGRFVAFESSAANLVESDTNGYTDIIVHDRQSGETTRISVSSAHSEANRSSANAAISGDGRYVAFESNASNLDPVDPDTWTDIYVHDRQTGQTAVVDVSSSGVLANNTSFDPALSGDGRYVVFESLASNLVVSDTNSARDIFARDRQTGQTTRVSVSSTGQQANSTSFDPLLSADGRYVVFRSNATNLVEGDANAVGDIFVHDRQTGQTVRASVSSTGEEANGSSASPAISPDGRFVTFSSDATNLVADDTNAQTDIFIRDLLTGRTSRVSVGGYAGEGNNWSSTPAISSYGRFVAFTAFASNLIPADTNNREDIFVAAKTEPAAAYLVRLEDRNGNALTYVNPTEVAARGPDRVSDGLGRQLVFSYATISGQPYLSQITDQASRTVRLGYEASPADNAGQTVLRAITDTLGKATTFRYAGNQLIAGTTMPVGNVPYTQTYNASYAPRGVVETQADAYGNTTRVQANRNTPYTDTVTQLTLTLPDATQRVYTHTNNARMAKALVDQTGRPITFTVDAARDQFSAVTDRLGATTGISYHIASGKLAGVTNAKGNAIVYSYSAQEQGFVNPTSPTERNTFTFYNLTGVDYPDGTNEGFTYDGKGNVLTRVDQAGRTWSYTYNGRGQVLTRTNPAGGIVTYAYNADGTLASRTDSDTGLTTFTYDPAMRPTRMDLPDGTDVRFGYDARDRVTSFTDGRGNTTTYTYDANGNLTTITDPLGRTATATYDLMDRPVLLADALGNQTTLTYDSRGRLASVADPTGVTRTLGYDPRGWVNWSTLGGQTWRLGYDDEGLVISGTTPLGRVNSYERDALGLITRATNALGQSASFQFDALSRLTGATDALGRTTAYAYDQNGLLSGVTMPVVGSTTFTRTALGLLSQIGDLNGRTWAFAYTPMGRQRTLTDPLGRTWEYSYDSRGRLSRTSFPDGTVLTRTYDAANNLTRLFYSDGTDLQYAYDVLNRLTSAGGIHLTYDAKGRVVNTENPGTGYGAAYDGADRLTSVGYAGGAFTVTYTYDAATGLLTGVSDNLIGARMGFVYDADFRLAAITRTNGVNTTLTWDAASRLTRLTDGTFLDLRYTLDAAGRVTGTQMTAPLDPAAAVATATDSHTYDGASGVATAGYVYDQRGRLTASPGQTYAWDDASRLVHIGGVALGYNDLGDLVTRTEGLSTTRYFYNAAIALRPIVAEKDENSGQFLRYYVWTPDGRLLYMVDAAGGNKVYFYHFDRAGSTVALTGHSGQVEDSYAYDPYGRLLSHQGTSPQPFTFVGRYGIRQQGSGGALYHVRARYYDAVTARFVSRDPIWPQTGDPLQINAYQYADLDPVNRIDVTGLGPLFNETWKYSENNLAAEIPDTPAPKPLVAVFGSGPDALLWIPSQPFLCCRPLEKDQRVVNKDNSESIKIQPSGEKTLASTGLTGHREAARKVTKSVPVQGLEPERERNFMEVFAENFVWQIGEEKARELQARFKGLSGEELEKELEEFYRDDPEAWWNWMGMMSYLMSVDPEGYARLFR